MRTLPEGMSEALVGSGHARMQFDVWYNGRLIQEDIAVGQWGQSFDRGRQITGSTTATVLDEAGDLTPWGVEDALGVGGARLHTRLFVGDSSVTLSQQRITDSDPEETWALTADGFTWVPGSSIIPIVAQDLTVMAVGSKFIASENPKPGGTCLSEIRRLLTGIMDVSIPANLVTKDRSIPSEIVYKEERMDAVEDLVSAMGLEARVNAAGQYALYDPTNETPVKQIVGGELGNLIRISRSQKIDGLYNAVRSNNTAPDGRELAQTAYETTGPLAWDGPHGRWPMRRKANFATNDASLLADAQTTLRNRVANRGVTIPIRMALDPSLEVGDWVEVMAPLPTGGTVPLPGSIEKIDYSGSSNVPVGMDILVACKMAAIQTASGEIRRSRWLGK